jgi:hypothetical protein
LLGLLGGPFPILVGYGLLLTALALFLPEAAVVVAGIRLLKGAFAISIGVHVLLSLVW